MKKNQTRILVLTALLAAIGTILNFIEIPSWIPWLKFDVSEIVVLVASVTLGLVPAIFVAFIKALLLFLIKPDWIGQMALLIGSLSIVIPFYLVSRKRSIVTSLVVTSIVFIVVMVSLNFLFITPLYNGASTFAEISANYTDPNYLPFILTTYVPFNVVKIVLVSIAFYFVNKLVVTKLPKYN